MRRAFHLMKSGWAALALCAFMTSALGVGNPSAAPPPTPKRVAKAPKPESQPAVSSKPPVSKRTVTVAQFKPGKAPAGITCKTGKLRYRKKRERFTKAYSKVAREVRENVTRRKPKKKISQAEKLKLIEEMTKLTEFVGPLGAISVRAYVQIKDYPRAIGCVRAQMDAIDKLPPGKPNDPTNCYTASTDPRGGAWGTLLFNLGSLAEKKETKEAGFGALFEEALIRAEKQAKYLPDFTRLYERLKYVDAGLANAMSKGAVASAKTSEEFSLAARTVPWRDQSFSRGGRTVRLKGNKALFDKMIG